MKDPKDWVIPIERLEPKPDPYKGERCCREPGICMRELCGDPRWQHPEKGELVLCQFHAEEVFRGEAKAPPLRQNLDYQSAGRRTFLVESLDGVYGYDSAETRFRRASGETLCTCGKPYWRHPLAEDVPGSDGPFLHRLCDGSLVKL